MVSPPPVKLGILSTATIGEYVLDGLKSVPNCTCTVVASRSAERAQEFASKHGIPTACTYEELFQQPVDAVYVPLPTAIATDWAVRFASAGFHVLVDKPLDSVEGVKRIVAACEEKNVYFMDATHFVHATRTHKIAERVRSGAIGDVKRIVSSFTIPIPLAGNIRANPELEPMGAMGDLGWYVMRSAVAFLGVDIASNVLSVTCTGSYHEDHKGVVESGDGIVVFGKGDSGRVTLCFSFDCNCTATQDSRIMGTRGCIDVPGFIIPPPQTMMYKHVRKPEDFTTDLDILTTMSVTGVDDAGNPEWVFPVTESETIQEHEHVSQVSMMMKEFSRMIQEKDSDAARKWAKESLATQKLVDMAFEELQKNATK